MHLKIWTKVPTSNVDTALHGSNAVLAFDFHVHQISFDHVEAWVQPFGDLCLLVASSLSNSSSLPVAEETVAAVQFFLVILTWREQEQRK